MQNSIFCLCFRNIMGNAASTAGENYSIIPAIQDTIMPHENYNQVIYFSRESNLSHRNNQYAGNATNAKRSSTDSDNAQIQTKRRKQRDNQNLIAQIELQLAKRKISSFNSFCSKSVKTWDIISTCTCYDWNFFGAEQFNFDLTFDKMHVCKGSGRDTCLNYFCLYKEENHELILSNVKSAQRSGINTKSNENLFNYIIKRILSSNKSTTKVEGKKVMDHIKYNYLPASFSSFQHYNVKGIINGSKTTHDNLLLISIYSEITAKTKFLLIDLTMNKFMSIFGDFNGFVKPSDVYAAWSYNRSLCVLRIKNMATEQQTSILNTARNTYLYVFDISKKEGKLLNSIKLNFADVIFGFDPSRLYRRLAITSYEDSNTVSIVDISQRGHIKVVSSSQQMITRNSAAVAQDIRFSRDGSAFVVTVVSTSCSCSSDDIDSKVFYMVFSAQGCQLLKELSSHLALCALHSCPSNFLPKISKCSSRLAIPVKNYNAGSASENSKLMGLYVFGSASERLSSKYLLREFKANQISAKSTAKQLDQQLIKIVQLPVEMSLKNLCRVVINRSLNDQSVIKDLPLPCSLKSYLYYYPQND